MTTTCAVCGSERLLNRTRLFFRIGGVVPGEVLLDVPPMGWAGSGAFQSHVRAATCIDCGHLHVHATDLSQLRAAYEAQQAEALHVA